MVSRGNPSMVFQCRFDHLIFLGNPRSKKGDVRFLSWLNIYGSMENGHFRRNCPIVRERVIPSANKCESLALIKMSLLYSYTRGIDQ